KLCFKIMHSSMLLLPQWKDLLKAELMPEKVLLHDVSTWWNSTFDMLQMVIHYQVAMKKFTADVMIIFTSSCFFLSHHHHPSLLPVLKDATLYFSCIRTPSLATMIPAMDMIGKVFATAAVNNTEFLATIQSSLLVAKKTLNWYYQLTDNSDVYRIAMVCHPVHKLDYFEQARWEPA
ncbi:hypothetical protein ARMGADRAFT_941876, partial [Armillaria gallica]